MDDSAKTFLEVKGIKATWKVAARLPYDVACRWHALPIAEEKGRITVAMANPEDVRARDIITSALGAPVYTVQASLDSIDELISELWTKHADQALKIRLWKPPNPTSEFLHTYAHSVSKLLGGELEQITLSGSSHEVYYEAIDKLARDKTDLLICEKPIQTFLDRLVTGSTGAMLLKDCPVATLFSGDQRLPIQKILLVVQGDGNDASAAEWAARFAKNSSAHLVALPVMVPVPEMYVEIQHEHHKLAGLLAGESPISCAVRKVMQQLVDQGIEGTFKIRNESPEWQICRECAEGDYDLVIIGAENQTWARKIFVNEIVYPVYSKITSPLLVSKPGHSKD